MGWVEDATPSGLPNMPPKISWANKPIIPKSKVPGITQPVAPAVSASSGGTGAPKGGADWAAKYPGSFGNPDCQSKKPEGCWKHKTGIYAQAGSQFGFPNEAAKQAALDKAKAEGSYKEGPEAEGDESDVEAEGSAEAQPTPEKPETVEVGETDIEVENEEQKEIAALLNKIVTSPEFSDEEKAKAKAAIEGLQKKLQENKEKAEQQAAQQAAQPEIQMQADLLGPMSDEDYAIAKGSDAVKAFKQQIREHIEQTGHGIDASEVVPGSVYERALNEVIAEMQAEGKKVAWEDEVDVIDFSEPEEATAPEGEQGAIVPEQAPQTEAFPGIIGKRDWTPEQKIALRNLADRFGAAMESIVTGADDRKFTRLLNDINKFGRIKSKWNSANPSEPMKKVETGISEMMEQHIDKSFAECTADKIDRLLAVEVLVDEAVSDSIKDDLNRLKEKLTDPRSTSKELQAANKEYRNLVSDYGLARYLSRERDGGEGETVHGYIEDGDENHRKGGVVSSKEEYPNWEMNLDNLPDEKEGNGSVKNAKEIKDKMIEDISGALNLTLLPEEIKETNYISTTDFTFKFPADNKITANTISSLKHDIARNFPLAEDKGLSINYNPRTDTLTVTVENDVKGNVSQKKVMQSPEFQKALERGEIPIALGLDEKGKPIVGNLTDYVHVLLAGQTNSGKSARLGSIVSSLLAQSPDDVKIIAVDPKRVEFSFLNGDPHLIGDVVTESGDAVKRLNYIVNEQENRYRLFQKAGVRNLKEYNALAKSGKLPAGFPKRLPALTLIIDEFGDLMDTNGKDIAGLVKRLGQKSRAAGVHLVLATQRPTAANLPTDIRANLPTTIGLNVKDWREAGYVGIKGLEQLPQKGPLIIKTPDGKTTRVDGSFMNEDGLSALIESSKGNEKVENPGATEATEYLNGSEALQKTPEQHIAELAQTPGAQKGLTAVSERISKGDLRPFNVPEGTNAEITKKFLESQGLEWIEDTETKGANGMVTITPKKKGPAPQPTEPAQGQASTEGETQTPAPAEGATSAPTSTSTEPAAPTTEGATPTEAPAAAPAPAPAENPFLDQDELNVISSDLGKAEVQSAVTDFYKAYVSYMDALKKGGAGVETAKANYGMAFERYNQARQDNGLPPVQRDTGKVAPVPQETSESPTEEAAPGTTEKEPSQSNPYFNSKETEGLAEFAKADIEDGAGRINNAINKWREARAADPFSKETAAARKEFAKAIEDDNKVRASLGLPARDKEGKVVAAGPKDEKAADTKKEVAPETKGTAPKTNAPENEPTSREEGTEEEQEGVEPPEKRSRISKARMDAIKEQTGAATKEAETAQPLGFSSRNDEEGGELPKPPKNPPTPPSGPDKTPPDGNPPPPPPEGGNGGGEPVTPVAPEAPNSGNKTESGSDTAPVSAEQPPKSETSTTTPAPEASTTQKSTAKVPKAEVSAGKGPLKTQDTEKANPEERKESDTPADALTRGMENLDEETRKAMQKDPAIQQLQANAVKAEAEHGKDSKEYKTAATMLAEGQQKFAESLHPQPEVKEDTKEKHEGKEKKEAPQKKESETKIEAKTEAGKSAAPTDKEIAKQVDADKNIKALSKKAEEAKSPSAKAKALKELNTAKTRLEEALRKAASENGGVEDVRAKKPSEEKKVSAKKEETVDVSKEEGKEAPKKETKNVEGKKTEVKTETSAEKAEETPPAKTPSGETPEMQKAIDNDPQVKDFREQAEESEKLFGKDSEEYQKAQNSVNKAIKDAKVNAVARLYQDAWEGTKGKPILPANQDMAKRFIKAIEDKNATALKAALATFAQKGKDGVTFPDDAGSRKAFEMLTGIKLPEPSKEAGDFKLSDPKDPDTQGYVKRMSKWVDDFCSKGNATESAPAKKDESAPVKHTASEKKESTATATEAKKNEQKTSTKQKEAEEKAAQQKQERQEQMKKQEAVGGSAGRDLNKQKSEFSAKTQQEADTSKSKGIKTLSEMKAPEKVDRASTKALNKDLAEVSIEIRDLERRLRDPDNPLSTKEAQQTEGLLANLRQGMKDLYEKHQLGKGNYEFKPDMQEGRLMGLQISSFKDSDGSMQPVEKAETDIHKMSPNDKVNAVAKIIDEQTRGSAGSRSAGATRESANALVTAFLKKDADALRESLRASNVGERKAFEVLTGESLPNTVKGTFEAIDKHCGISPEKRAKMDADKAAAREKAKAEAAKEEAVKAAAEKKMKSDAEKRHQEEDSAFESAVKGKMSLWNEDQEEESIESLMKKGWRFENIGGKPWFVNRKGEGYEIDKEMQTDFEDFNSFLGGAIRHGQKLDGKPTKDEALSEEEQEGQEIWNLIFDAALASMG